MLCAEACSVDDLKLVRDSLAWVENERARYDGLESLGIEESCRQFAELQSALAYQMELAEPVVRPIRLQHLIELQERLRALP
ncbi:MAG: hypothetical protein AMXMBFR33_43970 [Candidatus Xenobia bacterium]